MRHSGIAQSIVPFCWPLGAISRGDGSALLDVTVFQSKAPHLPRRPHLLPGARPYFKAPHLLQSAPFFEKASGSKCLEFLEPVEFPARWFFKFSRPQRRQRHRLPDSWAPFYYGQLDDLALNICRQKRSPTRRLSS